MLTRFEVKNYRAFPDSIVWDLTLASSYEFNPESVRDGIIQNGIIYGPNGSGKTSFANALFDIILHLTQNYRPIDYLRGYVYAGKPDNPVEFSYTFVFDGDKLEYSYTKNAKGELLTESLFVNGALSFNKSLNGLEVDSRQFDLVEERRVELGSNANHVSVFNNIVSTFPLQQDHYMMKMKRFVESMLLFWSLDSRGYMGFNPEQTSSLDEFIINKGLIDDFAAFLKEISGQRFSFSVSASSEKLLMCKYENSFVPFRDIISTGTRSLQLVYCWAKQMGKASFVFVDEFDAFYHFKLALAVCRKLFANGRQVFLSSHNTFLMTNDLLRPDCYFILKDGTIKSIASLTNKELRFGHNLEKLYRGGHFEGI